MRRPYRLPRAPFGGGAARNRNPGGGCAQDLPRTGRAGGGSRCGHRSLWRRHAARPGRDDVAGQVQSHSQDRSALAHGGGAGGRSQPRHFRSRCAPRPVLRARPEQPDRLHHWRQCCGKLRRRALPQVRPDSPQRAAGAWLHGRRRARHLRRRGSGRTGLRPALAHHRQRGHAGRDHRSHGEAGAQAAAGALHHGQLRRHPQWPR